MITVISMMIVEIYDDENDSNENIIEVNVDDNSIDIIITKSL